MVEEYKLYLLPIFVVKCETWPSIYVQVTNGHIDRDKQHKDKIKITMDILLCNMGKKRKNFYISLTFTLVQDWNNHVLFAQA